MKKIRTLDNKAGNFGGVLLVSLILVLSVVSFAAPGLSNPLPPKTIYGYGARCDGGSVSGASVTVTSSVGTKTTTCSGSGSWSVDVGPDTGTEWPDGTSFTVTITMSGWSGSGSFTVAGTTTNCGTINLNPTTALSATANANPTTVLVGNSVSFTGSASGGASPYSYSWDFNGEGSSTAQNPSFTFTSTGTKNCVLTVTDACSATATDSVSVTVNPALAAEAGGPYTGDVCDPVTFSGSATGGIPPYSYSWDFGGSGQNPTYQYTSDGSYTVTLTVTDSDSPPSTSLDTASVTISTSTLVAGAGGPYTGDVCNPVSFSGSASGGCDPYTYSWTFSDGGSASGQNPTHQFTSDGSFTATVTVNSADGQSDSDTVGVTISTSTLTCSVNGPSSGQVGSAVSFSASGSGGCSPYSYSWTFGDGGTGTGQSPSHTYTSGGSYIVTVTVTSSDAQTCSDSYTISISDVPLTADAHGPYEAIIGQEIDFFGTAIGGVQPYSFSWDFGDGSSGTGQAPSHTYTSAGTFVVTLTVTDSASPPATDTDTTNAIITSGDQPIADANGDYEGEVGEEIQFEGDVYGGTAPYTWYWEFGEGNTSDEQDPVFIYDEVGEYMVNLTVTDDNGYSDTDEVLCTIVPANDPPVKPETPTGDAEGKAGDEYTYTTTTTDPDGDAIFYKWDWGDGTTSDWLGPFGNGAEASESHTWDEQGDYSIKVKARDPSGEESPWSDPLPITMPHAKVFNLPLFVQMLLERFPFLGRFFALLF